MTAFVNFNQHLHQAKERLRVSFELRGKQVEALKAVYEGRDTFCMLRTGFGKSVIYQLTPFLLGMKSKNESCITLVISPLNSIMHDQVRKLGDKGLKACALDMQCRQGETYIFRSGDQIGSDEDDDTDNDEDDVCDSDDNFLHLSVPIEDVQQGKYQLIYAHPEAFLTSARGKAMLRSSTFQKNVCCVAIDEAHMIDEWGDNFRKDFSRLQEILALFPNVPALVVTATAAPKTQQKLISDLGLRQPCLVVAHPDRQNIIYFKKERSPATHQQDDLDYMLHETVLGIKNEGLHYPMTIMYCDLEIMSYVYRYLETALGDDQYVGKHCPENRIFAMYHQAYTDRMKNYIIAELSKGNASKVRFVVATVALGMGLDAPAVRRIIHFKSPTSIEKYLQETGRAGRDGLPADVTLYYNATDLRSNRPGQQTAMVEYCRLNDGCLREKLLQHLHFDVPKDRLLCRCCQFCKESCNCGQC